MYLKFRVKAKKYIPKNVAHITKPSGLKDIKKFCNGATQHLIKNNFDAESRDIRRLVMLL